MMEVSLFKADNDEYLKIELRTFSTEVIQAITSIPGWFKGKAPMVYGLPFKALGEFIKKTEDLLVVWKSEADSMGSIVKGIDTRDVPTEYIVDYKPKIELRPHQVQCFNLLMMKNELLISDEEGVGKLQTSC